MRMLYHTVERKAGYGRAALDASVRKTEAQSPDVRARVAGSTEHQPIVGTPTPNINTARARMLSAALVETQADESLSA
ncbi:hypothetical protein EXIGLDRAFT_736423 [Exidia glandulosa HHB12029]|uniref:Uncharacterized protein n=1 Tax=Exidia glandulosa HHB12029 TaxID=1314781 RepID=A0A166N7C0_EXIGL|nr:hypothetical protein EXIGLDRAFT_736423 [Exidia glandulosa HHB12029]